MLQFLQQFQSSPCKFVIDDAHHVRGVCPVTAHKFRELFFVRQILNPEIIKRFEMFFPVCNLRLLTNQDVHLVSDGLHLFGTHERFSQSHVQIVGDILEIACTPQNFALMGKQLNLFLQKILSNRL